MICSLLVLSVLSIASKAEVVVGNMHFLEGCRLDPSYCLVSIGNIAAGETCLLKKEKFRADRIPKTRELDAEELKELRVATDAKAARGILEVFEKLITVQSKETDVCLKLKDVFNNEIAGKVDLTPWLGELVVNIATPMLYKRTKLCNDKAANPSTYDENCIKENSKLIEWFGLTPISMKRVSVYSDQYVFHILERAYWLARNEEWGELEEAFVGFEDIWSEFQKKYSLGTNTVIKSTEMQIAGVDAKLTSLQSIRLAILYGKFIRDRHNTNVSDDIIVKGLWPPILGDYKQYDPNEVFPRKNPGTLTATTKPAGSDTLGKRVAPPDEHASDEILAHENTQSPGTAGRHQVKPGLSTMRILGVSLVGVCIAAIIAIAVMFVKSQNSLGMS